jgi:hypothetical protein
MGRVIVVIAAAALALPGAAHAQEPPRVAKYVDTFGSELPGTSASRHVETDFVNPDDPEGKPSPLSHVHVELAPGTVVDTSAVPECGASDAQLIAEGPERCPEGSVIGGGEVDIDTGFPGDARHLVADITFVNAPDQLVFVFTPRDGGPRVVVRGRYSNGNVLDIDVPPLPGAPPEGGADTGEAFTVEERAGYLTTPPTCPASGEWVNSVTYTFRDGVEQTFTATTPCKRPAAAGRGPLRVALRGVPRGRCVARTYTLYVRAASPARRVTLYLDGRRIGKTDADRLATRIRAHRLAPGRHRLKAIARDFTGRVAVARKSFRRC